MDYSAIAYGLKIVDDGSIVRYNYRWNDIGKALAKEVNFMHKYLIKQEFI